MSYSKLGVPTVLRPDLNSLYQISGDIQSGFSTLSISGTGSNSNPLIISGSGNAVYVNTSSVSGSGIKYIQLESEWPAPCEYLSPILLSSDFIETTEAQATGIFTGVRIFNLLNSIKNLSTGNSVTGQLLDNTIYRFSLILKSTTGTLTGLIGEVSYDEYNPFGTSSSTITPSSGLINGSGIYSFTGAIEGYSYTVESTKNISSGWNYTAVNLYPSVDQTNVPIGYLKQEFIVPLSQELFRIQAQTLSNISLGIYNLLCSGNILYLTYDGSVRGNDGYYTLFSSGNNSGTLIKQKSSITA